MTYDAADQSQIDRRRSRKDYVEATRKVVIQSLMCNARGRLYIWEELSLMNVFAQTLQFGRDGHVATAFAEGRRSLGLRLLTDVTKWCPDEYLLMTKENAKTGVEENAEEPVAE